MQLFVRGIKHFIVQHFKNKLRQTQVPDWNFEETFQFVSALLKLDWNLQIGFQLMETWRNSAETIQKVPHCSNYTGNSTQSFYIVSAVCQFYWYAIFHPVKALWINILGRQMRQIVKDFIWKFILSRLLILYSMMNWRFLL